MHVVLITVSTFISSVKFFVGFWVVMKLKRTSSISYSFSDSHFPLISILLAICLGLYQFMIIIPMNNPYTVLTKGQWLPQKYYWGKGLWLKFSTLVPHIFCNWTLDVLSWGLHWLFIEFLYPNDLVLISEPLMEPLLKLGDWEIHFLKKGF